MAATDIGTILLGDTVQMKKAHPCGSFHWTVVRTGADIKIRCCGCGHLVMLDRESFIKRCRKIISHAGENDIP